MAAFGDESALVGADTTEADAANGERRKNASSDDADVPGDHPEQAEGADTRPSNTGSGTTTYRALLSSSSCGGGGELSIFALEPQEDPSCVPFRPWEVRFGATREEEKTSKPFYD